MSGRFAAIHQFHSGASPGDAITNQMFALQAELRSMGFKSEIFAEHFDGELATSIKHIDSFVPSSDELILVHHSMGHRRLDQILAFSNPIVTVYHNITPPQELVDIGYKHFAHIGRHQLDILAQRSLMGIADSHYNRKEMLQRGFTQVEVIPVRTDFREFESARESRNPERDWLFVGRIAPNKQQVEIIRAFHHYHHNVDKSARLFLVGDHKMRNYVDEVGREIERLGLVSHVDATGKLEDVDLIHRYARAGVFVSLSRHEGFGVPLLEAMASGVPVVALESSAVTETMGGAGVLIGSADPEVVSNAVKHVMTNPGHRHDVVWRQDRRLEKLTRFDVRGALNRVLNQIDGQSFPIRLQVQGPIETSYSLAIINRETAFQLKKGRDFDTSVYPTEGPGDYPPNLGLMDEIPNLKDLYERGLTTQYPDVVIRNMYPPRVKDSTGVCTIQSFAWEESTVPKEFVHDFNRHVDRMVVTSTYVRTVLVNSGVVIPIDVVGNGVRRPVSNPQFVIPELEALRGSRLLHISSAFPRKGVDVLLRAYFGEFSGADDVSLVLKTFPNQHNTVAEMLDNLVASHADPPHVVWINRDLPLEALGNLYGIASAYVHPARGEGFGLPVAEAMLAEVPVISTDNSGLADFVSAETAAVIPSVAVQSQSHVASPGSQWFEPDETALRAEMRSLVNGSHEIERARRVQTARELVASEFSWEAVGSRIAESVRATLRRPTSIRVKHITTYNSRCGIAEYSALLQSAFPRNVHSTTIADRGARPIDLAVEEDTVRLWDQVRHQDVNALATAIKLSSAEIVHLQYNYGFFSMEDLSELIAQLKNTKPIVITLHRTKDLDRGHEMVSLSHAAPALRQVDAIIVHEEHDVRRLAEFGISDNVVLIPHAAMPFSGDRTTRSYVPGQEMRIGTFGFLLPHKGLDVTLESLHSLNYRGRSASLTALCSLHPDPSSDATFHKVTDIIERWGLSPHVRLDTGFKSVKQIHSELSEVDIIVLPYSQTEESSSGVLAMLLGIGKPIIATDLDIFMGAKNSILTIPDPARSDDLTQAIIEMADSPERMADLGARAGQRAIDISWGSIARRTSDLYETLLGR